MNRTSTVKIAISLPESLLRDVERAREETDESRSAFFRRAAELLLRASRHRDRVAEYVEGYLRLPETAEEIRNAEAAAEEVLGDEDWA